MSKADLMVLVSIGTVVLFLASLAWEERPRKKAK